ncbi:hypothetical protein BH09PSE2_BH09PSE2_22640 [soil metagenome]
MGRLYRGQPVFSAGDWLPTLSRIPNRDAVALTFDDGPNPETTPKILQLLKWRDAKATFFLSGERAAAAPDLVRAIVAEGHDIYAHGWSHIRLKDQPADLLYDEMERTEVFLSQFRPTPTPYLVRLPYASGIREAAVHRAIASWAPDAQLAAWTYATRDDHLPVGAVDLAQLEWRCDVEFEVMMRRPKLGGAILLMHEKGYDVDAPLNAALAPLLLTRLLPRLEEAGLGVESLRPLPAAPPLSRYVLSVSI